MRITDKHRLNFLIVTYFMAWPRGFGRKEIDAAIRATRKKSKPEPAALDKEKP